MTTMESFSPINELERALLDAQERRWSVTQFVETLLSSRAVVLLDRAPGPGDTWDNSATPLVLSGSAGVSMLVVFTSPERSVGWPARFPQFAFGLLVEFRWLFQGVTPGVGVVINPGSPVGLEFPPSGVSQLKTEMVKG